MISEDAQWLFMQYQHATNILLIDCRTLNEYSKGHIEGAINLFVPPLMLRRLKRGNVPLTKFVNSEVAKEKFDSRTSCERIVLYDESTCNVASDSCIDALAKKLLETNSIVVYLKGGFRRFEECFPHLCTCGEGSELNSAIFDLASLSLFGGRGTEETVPSPLLDVTLSQGVGNVKDLLFRPDSSGPIEIISNLYLGNKVDASSLELLRKAKISHILNVTPDLPNSFEDGGCNGDSSRGFEYTRLAVKDDWTGDLVSRFTEAYEFIDKAINKDGRVLVHCVGGISRSSTIIIAYLMLKYDYSLNDAYDIVKFKKSNIAPNFNFMGQLLELERKRQEDLSSSSSPSTATSSSFSFHPATPGSISPGSISTSSDISAASC